MIEEKSEALKKEAWEKCKHDLRGSVPDKVLDELGESFNDVMERYIFSMKQKESLSDS